jgi:hypothetical protein
MTHRSSCYGTERFVRTVRAPERSDRDALVAPSTTINLSRLTHTFDPKPMNAPHIAS